MKIRSAHLSCAMAQLIFRAAIIPAFLVALFPTQACARPASAPQSPSASETRPFLIGAFVGANMHDWGDIANMGEDALSTNRAIAADLRAIGCNAVWVTGFAPHFADTPLMGSWLDAAGENNLLAVIEGSGEPYSIPRQGPGPERIETTRRDVIPAWRQIVRTYRDHPSLLAWSPVEEIDDNVENGEEYTVQSLAELGRAIEKEDLAHPTVTIHIAPWINVAEAEARLRGKNLKTVVFDLYVFADVHDWTSEGYAYKTNQEATQGLLDWSAKYEDFGRRHSVDVWAMFQSNQTRWVKRVGPEGRTEERNNFRMPGAAEMRFQIWVAALSGMKGVFFFQYGSNPQPPVETRAELQEWEYGIGMRSLDGKPTASHSGLAQATAEIGPLLSLIGRLIPDGQIQEDEMILTRSFQDRSNGDRYEMMVNRNLGFAGAIPDSMAKRLGMDSGDSLPPGGGRLIKH